MIHLLNLSPEKLGEFSRRFYGAANNQSNWEVTEMQRAIGDAMLLVQRAREVKEPPLVWGADVYADLYRIHPPRGNAHLLIEDHQHTIARVDGEVADAFLRADALRKGAYLLVATALGMLHEACELEAEAAPPEPEQRT